MKKAIKFLLVGLVAFSQLAYPVEVYAKVIDEVVENNEITTEEDINNLDENSNLEEENTTLEENNNLEVKDKETEAFSSLGSNITTLNIEKNNSYNFDITTKLTDENVNINLTNTDDGVILDENKYIIKATLSFNKILDNEVVETTEETKTILLTGLELKNYDLIFNNIGKGINGKYQFDVKMYTTDDDLVSTDEESLNKYIENRDTIYTNSLVDFHTNKIDTKLVLEATNLICNDKNCTMEVGALDKKVTFSPKIIEGSTSIEKLNGAYYTYKVNDEIELNKYNFNNSLDFSLLLYGTYKISVTLMDKDGNPILTDTLNITYGNSEDNTNLENYYNLTGEESEEILLAKLISTTVVDDNVIDKLVDVETLKNRIYKTPIDNLISNTLTDKYGYNIIANSFDELDETGNYYSTITSVDFVGRFNDSSNLAKVQDIINYLCDTGIKASIIDKNNNSVSGDKYIATGMKLVINMDSYELTYQFIVKGDLDGGVVSDSEVNKLINVALGIETLGVIETKAVDMNNDGIIDISDISYLAGSIGMQNWLDDTSITDKISASLIANKTGIRVNDTFTVTLNLKGFNNDYINGIEGILDYDKNSLELIGLSTQNSLNQYGNFNYSASKFIQAGKEIVNEDRTIITFTFKALKEGSTNIGLKNLKVAKDGSTTSVDNSSLSVKVDRQLSNNNDIVELKPSTGRLDKEFNKDVYEYTLYVDYRTETINLEGLLGDKYATTMGFKEYKLTGDKTVIILEVVSESGEVKTYKITVVKEYPETSVTKMSLSSNNYLKTLEIEGYDIKFDKDTLEYEITVGSDVTSLDITAIAELNSANVRIYGNDNFKEGENIVTIVVTAEDGSEKTYTIKVNKEAKSEVKADDADEEDESSNNTEKTIIIILIILVVIGLLYLIFKKDDDDKTKKEQK